MDTKLVNLEIPANLYEQLQSLADEKHTDPLSIITQLVTEADRRRHWLQDLNVLRQQIQNESSLELGNTKEEIIAQLRQTRQEIFETEYAHLYR